MSKSNTVVASELKGNHPSIPKLQAYQNLGINSNCLTPKPNHVIIIEASLELLELHVQPERHLIRNF